MAVMAPAEPLVPAVLHALPMLPDILESMRESQDPADSIYNRARRELNNGNYRRAAELFEDFRDRSPRSAYVADAYYWQAWALYKTNDTDDLEEAKDLLESQRNRFPQRLRSQASELLTVVQTALAKRGNAEAAEAVTVGANRTLAQGCPRRDDDDERDAALQALMQMDAANAMPVLKRIMAKRDECSASLRRKAVFQIAQQRSDEREDLLLEAARNDPDREVRRQAVFWLSQVNTPKALDAIQEILNNSNDPSVQENALFALSQHRSPRAGQILREWALGNRPMALREKAIFQLSQQRDPENGKFLRDMYTKVDDGRLKRQILFALSQRRGEGNETFMLDIARNDQEDVEVRKQALFFAGQMRGVQAADLIGLYDKMTSRAMKEQLIYTFSQVRNADVVDKMMDIAKNDKDPELRKKAIFWLSQSKDPRVAKFLLEIIER
jgi:HEAT repeat protein